MTSKTKQPSKGRFAYEGLDRVIHEKARLSALTSLSRTPRGCASAISSSCATLTDGNLSRHLEVLEEAGLVAIVKSFERNRPKTVCRITPEGRKRYMRYLNVLEQVVRDAAAANNGPLPNLKGPNLKGLAPA